MVADLTTPLHQHNAFNEHLGLLLGVLPVFELSIATNSDITSSSGHKPTSTEATETKQIAYFKACADTMTVLQHEP